MEDSAAAIDDNSEDIKFYALAPGTPLYVSISFNKLASIRSGTLQKTVFEISNELMVSLLERYLYVYDFDYYSDPREAFVELTRDWFKLAKDGASWKYSTGGVNSDSLTFQDHYGQVVKVERKNDRLKWTVTSEGNQPLGTINFDSQDFLKIAKLFFEGLHCDGSDPREDLQKKITATEVIQGRHEWSRKLSFDKTQDERINSLLKPPSNGVFRKVIFVIGLILISYAGSIALVKAAENHHATIQDCETFDC